MHHQFDEPVVAYMNRDLERARLDTSLHDIARTLDARGISGLPIVDNRGVLVGVVTRTDLISAGLEAGGPTALTSMTLPNRRASDVMTHDPATVSSSHSLRRAARLMIDSQIHRVFVSEGGKLSGVLCAIDLAAAVRDARLDAPLSSIMTSPIITVDVQTQLADAIELLDRVHLTGLIVTEDGQPIGMFTQHDALASRELPPTTPIETVYDAVVTCLPAQMKLHRAAAHVADLQVRRVVVCKAREPIGIVSATDFARVVALS